MAHTDHDSNLDSTYAVVTTYYPLSTKYHSPCEALEDPLLPLVVRQVEELWGGLGDEAGEDAGAAAAHRRGRGDVERDADRALGLIMD